MTYFLKKHKKLDDVLLQGPEINPSPHNYPAFSYGPEPVDEDKCECEIPQILLSVGYTTGVYTICGKCSKRYWKEPEYLKDLNRRLVELEARIDDKLAKLNSLTSALNYPDVSEVINVDSKEEDQVRYPEGIYCYIRIETCNKGATTMADMHQGSFRIYINAKWKGNKATHDTIPSDFLGYSVEYGFNVITKELPSSSSPALLYINIEEAVNKAVEILNVNVPQEKRENKYLRVIFNSMFYSEETRHWEPFNVYVKREGFDDSWIIDLELAAWDAFRFKNMNKPRIKSAASYIDGRYNDMILDYRTYLREKGKLHRLAELDKYWGKRSKEEYIERIREFLMEARHSEEEWTVSIYIEHGCQYEHILEHMEKDEGSCKECVLKGLKWVW